MREEDRRAALRLVEACRGSTPAEVEARRADYLVELERRAEARRARREGT